jgi:hypothetical protein
MKLHNYLQESRYLVDQDGSTILKKRTERKVVVMIWAELN